MLAVSLWLSRPARSSRTYSSDPGTSPETLTPRELLAGEPHVLQASTLVEHSGLGDNPRSVGVPDHRVT
jgi:hypothetical protein